MLDRDSFQPTRRFCTYAKQDRAREQLKIIESGQFIMASESRQGSLSVSHFLVVQRVQ